jgi:hypothetical protein
VCVRERLCVHVWTQYTSWFVDPPHFPVAPVLQQHMNALTHQPTSMVALIILL